LYLYTKLIETSSKYQISTLKTLKKKPLTKESTLVINNANKQDEGIYKCRGSTGILEDESTFNIIVTKKG